MNHSPFASLVLLLGTVTGSSVAAAQTVDGGFEWGERNTDYPPAFDEQFRAPVSPSGVELATRVLADGLDVPWGVTELPDGAGLNGTRISSEPQRRS